ncbi:hypothetical protein C8J57DRAFT_1511883 [Mycena rebaudengoi]|nr:hypothetical protein C8J57DRAFT_1511883 [Mycena rebaudengoi]
MVTTGSQLAPYFTDQRPVHATEDEEEQLSTFTNYGYEQFTNTWIGQPPVNFGAPRNHYDIQKMRDFCDYMASGRESDPTTGDRFQYVVVHDEAIAASNQRAQAGNFSIKRDYDSVLAISSAFPVTQTDVELYTIPNFKKGLQGSTHLKLRFAVDGGGHEAQDPSEHTTCLFGTFGASSRNNIYLCFPNEEAAKLEARVMQEAIYEAVRQAHAETFPDNYHGYAASFDAEMARAPNNSSKLLLARYGVPDFMEIFQTVLKAACPWAVTHYFLAQIRGVKDAFRHSRNCRAMLDKLVENIDTDPDRTVIYVDVGLEASLDQLGQEIDTMWSSLPTASLEPHLGIMDLDAGDIRGVKTYFDPWCGMVGIGGFRLDATGLDGGMGRYGAIYAQIYTTDKFGTYHQAGSHNSQGTAAIQLQPIDVVRMPDGSSVPKVCSRLSEIFLENIDIPVHARYELRVPYENTCLALWGRQSNASQIRVSQLDLEGLFAVYETNVLWRYRWLNLAAATWLIQELADVAPQEQRACSDALVVASGAAYFINAVCARPSDKSWWRGVASAIFPLSPAATNVHERYYLWDHPRTDGPLVPYFEKGRMWLPHIMWPGPGGSSVRFVYSPNRILLVDDIPKVFGNLTRKKIEARYTIHKTIAGREDAAKRKCSAPEPLECDNPVVPQAALDIVFDPRFAFDCRGDLPAHEMTDDRWMGSSHPTILLSKLLLTQQRLVGLETFRDPNISVYWDRVQWRKVPNFNESFDLLLVNANRLAHLDEAGKKPTPMIRILITADKPPPTRETKPVLDAQMLQQYIENNVPEDNHVAPVTAETVLAQHANRLQITAAQREQLMRRPPGTRLPAYINIREEEEESSGEENN